MHSHGSPKTIMMMILMVAYIPSFLVCSASASITVRPGVYFRPDTATQGLYSFASPASFDTFTRDASSKIDKFTGISLGAYKWMNLGFASDTPGCSMIITGIDSYSLTYTVNSTGTQRIYSPDLDSSITVSGGSGSYNSATRTITVTTTGASTVTVKWEVAGSRVETAGLTLSSMLPLLALVSIVFAAKSGKGLSSVTTVFYIIVFTAVASLLLRLWGI